MDFRLEKLSHVIGKMYILKSLYKTEDVSVLRGIPLKRAEDFAMTEPETLKATIADWEKEADAKRHRAKQDELQSLFDEYKSERRRGLV